MHVVIHTDGGSRGNPGPAASAFFVSTNQNETLHEQKLFIGNATNNIAEYTALRMAWDWIVESTRLNLESVDFLLDSELVVKQMRGEYKIKDQSLLQIAARIKQMESSSKLKVTYVHVPRAQNAYADKLVNAALDAEITH